MKYLVVSDIHGSAGYLKKFIKTIESENPDKIILLGDVYYHGPRNKLPKGYAPMKVANMLNSVADKIICVQGNCDAEVDQMISKFELQQSYETEISGKKFLFVHGHHLNFQDMPKGYDFVFGGHTHVCGIKPVQEVTYVNPGSLSIPKGGTTNSYAKIDDGEILIFSIKGKVLDKIKI